MSSSRSVIGGLFVSVILFVGAALAHPAQAQVADAASGPMILHVDQGFVDYGASFDLLDGQAAIRWTAGGLVRPTDLFVQKTAEGDLSVHWETSDALGPKGVEVSFVDATSTRTPWDVAVIQFKPPFGVWKDLPTMAKDGRVSARMTAPEGRFRVATRSSGMRSGKATWYKYKGCPCAASPDYPKGTKVLVTSQADPAKQVIVRINDWGPDRALFPDRAIDLDKTAFVKLSPTSAGVVRVNVEPLAPTDPRSIAFDAAEAKSATKTVAKK